MWLGRQGSRGGLSRSSCLSRRWCGIYEAKPRGTRSRLLCNASQRLYFPVNYFIFSKRLYLACTFCKFLSRPAYSTVTLFARFLG